VRTPLGNFLIKFPSSHKSSGGPGLIHYSLHASAFATNAFLLLPSMCEEQLQKQFKTQINASRADRPAAAKYHIRARVF
jgi:hypothetical protein